MRQLALLILLALSGCSREPRTELVRRMEEAGAGDLRSVTGPSIEQWFEWHPALAGEINRACRPLRLLAPARWNDTTDGRICAAAAQALYRAIRPARIIF